jgi:hypothetical protein
VEALVDPDDNTFDPEDDASNDSDYAPQAKRRKLTSSEHSPNGASAPNPQSEQTVDSRLSDFGERPQSKTIEEDSIAEPEETIRCICGTSEEQNVGRTMICCGSYSVWQHNSCMNLSEDHNPDEYFCEECRPRDHQDLVAMPE